MKSSTLKVLIASLLMLVMFTSAQRCQKGSISVGNNCLECSKLDHVRTEDVEFFSDANRCPCKQGYVWSTALLRCIAQSTTGKNILYTGQEAQLAIQPARLLAPSTCPTSQGFVIYSNNSVCVNCRQITFALGVPVSNTSCTCMPNFVWQSNLCYCGYYLFIDDFAGGVCSPCSTLPASLVNNCTKCNFPFYYSRYGCIKCANLPNNGGSTSCCATGFSFSYTLGQCVCDAGAGYAINSAGVCTKCGSSDSNCLKCKTTYVYTGYKCVHGSQIPGYDINAGACSTGSIFQNDQQTNEIVSCGCSGAAGYYQGAAGCTACTATYPSGTSLTNCKNCVASAGYYKGAVQCIACSSDANSVGTATASGCDCKTNYYWNNDADKCMCDFTLGYVGGATASCTNCSAISNTGPGVNPNGCSCLPGFKWSQVTKKCDCDTSNPSVFTYNGACINCASMEGSTGAVSGSSCVCINSFFWNAGTSKCECDAAQNFAVFPTGYCTDCSLAPLSTGLGSGQGCVCQNSYVWSSADHVCGCPAGYALLGATCTICTDAGFASAPDCKTCSGSGGYASQNGICALCKSQIGVSSGAVVSGSCNCPSGKIWSASQGACVCDWSKGFVTSSTDGSTFTCLDCPYTWTSSGKCACGFSLYYLGSSGTICTDCTADPNARIDSKGNCVCKSGYGWSELTYPFKCTRNFAGGYYTGSNGVAACSSLGSSSLQTACLSCDLSKGFVLVSSINTCINCNAVTGATGDAQLNGCACSVGKIWNPVTFSCDSATCNSGFTYNPTTAACDCDPVYSVVLSGVCTFCGGIANSLGFVDKSGSACACKSPNTWSGTDCSGSPSCNSATSISIGGSCFTCPTTDNGSGAPDKADSAKCGCVPANFVWQATPIGGSCVCPTGYVLVDATTCSACPSAPSTTVNSVTCPCSNNYFWTSSPLGCFCDSTVNAIKLGDGTCFKCDPGIDSRFNGTASSTACKCSNGYTFINNGTNSYCACNSPSTLVNGICVSCPNTTNTTGFFDGKGGCACKLDYVWSATKNDCICDATVKGIPLATGCFRCLKSVDPNFDGTITGSACNCINGWTWTANTYGGYCTCASTSYVFNGVCSTCPSTVNTTGVSDGGSGCLCKNDFIWNQASNDCICDASVNAILISSTVCFQCTLSNTSSTSFFDGTISSGTCNCLDGFTAGYTANGLPTCSCPAPSILSPSGTCITCNSPTSSGPDKSNTTCACINGYTWDTTNLACTCPTLTSVIGTNGSCLKCGATGTYTKSRRSSVACSCSPSSLTWNLDALMCDCGPKSALVTNGNSVSCSSCTSKNNAVSKNDSFSCICSASILTWNPTTGKCDCGASGFYLNTATNNTCIYCDASRYATGLASNKNSCSCLSGMTWSKDSLSCACSGNNVIFNVNGTITCQACGPSIISMNTKASTTACNCYSNSVWVPNTGCVCTGSGAIPILGKNTIACVVCDATIYSSGSAANLKSCICLGSLVWSNTTFRCGCPSNQVIAVSNGQYFCTPCSASNNAKLPLLNNNTQCTCSFANLTWYIQGFCGCPDPAQQVVGSTGNCITCDDSINSNGKVTVNATTCKCISSVLSFNNGVCDCGADSAYVVTGLSNFVCVKCKNSSAFVVSKNSSSSCNCVSASLVWNPASSACICPDPTQIIVQSGKNYTCMDCSGQYALAPNGLNTCSCLGSGLVFTPSASGGSCACPKGYIMLSNFTCFLCPSNTTTSTPYECKCSDGGSIWNNLKLKCQACGSAELPNSISGGNSALACKCKASYVWDVFTQSCVTVCAANDTTCLNCDSYYPDVLGPAATLNSATSKNLTGWQTVKSAVNGTYTNYALLKTLQCSCVSGEVWDFVRLRCFNSLLV